MSDAARAVPVEGDRERLAALLRDCPDEMGYADCADRLLRAGVSLTGSGLREAARSVVDKAEPDDDFEGQFIEYLVPYDAIAALRAALSGESGEPNR